MDANNNIVDVTTENAQQVLIDESHNQPVIAYFWTSRSQACQQLGPILEKLAAENAGKCLLARVDCDSQQMIASQFGVQSLPTTVIVKDGQPVDGFADAQPEQAIRDMLAQHMPQPWDELHQQGQAKIAEGDFGNALAPLRQAYDQSRERTDIALTLAHAFIELNRTEEAQAVLDKIKLAEQDARYEQLRAQLEVKQQAAKSPELEALEQQRRDNPNDLTIAYNLALQYSQHQHHKDAMELLLHILRQDRDFEDGAARALLLDIFKSLGPGDPAVAHYQRQLFSLLY